LVPRSRDWKITVRGRIRLGEFRLVRLRAMFLLAASIESYTGEGGRDDGPNYSVQ
jgi:hypothetical protein